MVYWTDTSFFKDVFEFMLLEKFLSISFKIEVNDDKV